MSNPFALFEQWYAAAEEAKVIEPNAMVLSSVDQNHRPTSRVVLFRRFIDEKIYFFTNYTSTKSRQLTQNPHACLNFHWRAPQHRQIRIEGVFEKATSAISDEYFSTRPRGSQIGAWASPQSQEIRGREELEALVQDIEKRFEGQTVPRPDFWGGWGLSPTRFEFWQEGESRLHTRSVYERDGAGWKTKIVAP